MGSIEGEEVVAVLEYADLFSPIPDAAEWKGFRQFQAVADFETVIRNHFDSFDIAVAALQDVDVFGPGVRRVAFIAACVRSDTQTETASVHDFVQMEPVVGFFRIFAQQAYSNFEESAADGGLVVSEDAEKLFGGAAYVVVAECVFAVKPAVGIYIPVFYDASENAAGVEAGAPVVAARLAKFDA